MYSNGGLFQEKKPPQLDKLVDLHGLYVIPPLAEAHTHWVEPQQADVYIRQYLQNGIFYVQDEGNSPYIVSQFQAKVNRPGSVDFVSALQGFTEHGAHPVEMWLQLEEMGVLPRNWGEKGLDGNVLIFVDSLADISRKWPLLVKSHPAFVKAFLQYSEEYEQRKRDPAHTYQHGLNPAFLPEIVRRAHDAGLLVSVHICTAVDFHNALMAGADVIAHLPLVDLHQGLSKKHFIVTEDDAKLAKTRNVAVISTVSWLADKRTANPREAAEIQRDIMIPNLKLMKRYGVSLLVGSDQFRKNSLPEILLLSKLRVFSNKELLKISCETTPRTIFPKRKIGYLRDGYEASFLALERNPLLDMNNLGTIKMRVKQGTFIDIE